MKIYPQQSLIVVEPIPNEDTTIVIPTIKDEVHDTDAPNEALRLRVIEVGPGRTLNDGTLLPVPLKIGDEVMINFKYAQLMVPPSWYGGGMKWVVDYAGVLARIEREPGEKVSRFHIPKPPEEAKPKPQILIPRHVSVG